MRYEIDKNGCWNFLGMIGEDGYGKVSFKGMTIRAHRLIAHICIKPLMSDKEIIAHRCDNPRCINPEHLFITTSLGNMQDRDSKGRGARGEKSKLSKLKEIDVISIRFKYSNGESLSKIAKNYPQISVGCVQSIIERRSWKWLD